MNTVGGMVSGAIAEGIRLLQPAGLSLLRKSPKGFGSYNGAPVAYSPVAFGRCGIAHKAIHRLPSTRAVNARAHFPVLRYSAPFPGDRGPVTGARAWNRRSISRIAVRRVKLALPSVLSVGQRNPPSSCSFHA